MSRVLTEHRPDDAVLSEEAADGEARLDASRAWIIDPLDGTREYGEHRHDWAVHVAFVVAGQPVASAVALPSFDQVLSSADAALGDRRDGPIRMTVSRSRPAAETLKVAETLGAEVIPMGSAGYKAMAVVRGEVDAYLHSGGQWEWDTCAPIGVARAAGLHTSRIDGSELVFNQPVPKSPDMLICRPELAEQFLEVLNQ